MSLREELLGLAPATPLFRMLLPDEWQCFPVTPDLGNEVELRTREVFKKAGRPDLDGQFTAELHRSMQGLERAGAKYILLPTNRAADKAPLSLSMIITFVDSPDRSLDGWVTARIHEGAQLLDPEGKIVFWHARTEGTDGETQQTQSTYVIPVPGSNRRQALMLRGTALIGIDTPDDDEYVTAVHSIFDAMASTVAWVRADEAVTAP
ncbi:hypothetical protein GCM10027416_32450 [Okibacterium endophyticum]